MAFGGILGKVDNISDDVLFKLFNNIVNRGPDRSNYSTFKYSIPIKIGFHRLSIMDLSTNGDQPFLYEDNQKTIFCLCNGEIYNYKELIKEFNFDDYKSNSDCEVIIHLYKLGGINLVVKNL